MSTQTHNELKKAGLLQSYWGKIILDAEDEGVFTSQDNFEAGKWQTCACGRQSPNIPRVAKRDEDAEFPAQLAEPLDDELKQDGLKFAHLVDDNNFLGAAECLVRIEKRAATVMGAELDKYVMRMDWHVPHAE